MKPKKVDLPPEVQKLMDEHPVLVITGLLVLCSLMSGPRKRVDVPGLGERTNAAWRGPGSYGHAPFGSQISHRR